MRSVSNGFDFFSPAVCLKCHIVYTKFKLFIYDRRLSMDQFQQARSFQYPLLPSGTRLTAPVLSTTPFSGFQPGNRARTLYNRISAISANLLWSCWRTLVAHQSPPSSGGSGRCSSYASGPGPSIFSLLSSMFAIRLTYSSEVPTTSQSSCASPCR